MVNEEILPKQDRSVAALAVAEQGRVDAIIERDRADRQREIDRRVARSLVESGNYERITETVMEPTPEWLKKGDTMPFTPRQHDRTTRVFKTVRRVSTPIVLRMWKAGKLSDDHARACLWYRDRWESAGLDGRVKSSHLSLSGNTGGGSGGMGQAPMAIHEREAIARREYRDARDAIAPVLLRMFEAVVLGNVPLRRTERFVRCRNGQIKQRFIAACGDLMAHCERLGLEISGADCDEVG